MTFSTVLLSNLCTFCPHLSFFFNCFGWRLFFHWSFDQLQWGAYKLYAVIEELICIPFSFKCVFSALPVLWVSFLFCPTKHCPLEKTKHCLLMTTLPFALRRNRSSILFQLDDTADSCKTHTNHRSHLSIRLSCVFVQSYDLRTFPGYHVHLAWWLSYDDFTVDAKDKVSTLIQQRLTQWLHQPTYKN